MTTPSSIRIDVLSCTACKLRATCKSPVPGKGNLSIAGVFCFGESPNWQEDKWNTSFVGNHGKEHDNYLRQVGINPEYIYCTNAVKCKVPFEDSFEDGEEIIRITEENSKLCKEHLDREIELFQGSILAPMGYFACRLVLGKYFDLDKHHGIPIVGFYMTNTEEFREFIVVPMLHPAIAIAKKKTFKMALIKQDYEALAKVVKGELTPDSSIDIFTNPNYRVLTGVEVWEVLNAHDEFFSLHELIQNKEIAIDTETTADFQTPQSLQFSLECGTGYYIDSNDTDGLSFIADYVKRPDVTTVFHHAKFDLRVCKKLGIEPAKFGDSMVAAYHLQTYPMGLKPLAYRLHGLNMTSFGALTYGPTRAKYLDYFKQILEIEWPTPETIEEWCAESQFKYDLVEEHIPCTSRKKGSIECECQSILGSDCPICSGKGYYYTKSKRGEKKLIEGTENGYWKTKQPQSIESKIKRIVADNDKHGTDINVRDRFNSLDDGSKELIECMIGPIQPCDLSHINPLTKLNYACKDADATLRVWQTLFSEIKYKGLEAIFWLDMEILDMVIDMEDTGFEIVTEQFATLSAYYKETMKLIESDINRVAGYKINVGSSAQVAKLLYDDLKIVCQKDTKKKEPSTDKEALKLILSCHPVVKMIMDWRSYQKNDSSFADKLPRMAR